MQASWRVWLVFGWIRLWKIMRLMIMTPLPNSKACIISVIATPYPNWRTQPCVGMISIVVSLCEVSGLGNHYLIVWFKIVWKFEYISLIRCSKNKVHVMTVIVTCLCEVSRLRNRHLVIWFRVARKSEYTSLVRCLKSKRLIVIKEDVSTPNVSCLR